MESRDVGIREGPGAQRNERDRGDKHVKRPVDGGARRSVRDANYVTGRRAVI